MVMSNACHLLTLLNRKPFPDTEWTLGTQLRIKISDGRERKSNLGIIWIFISAIQQLYNLSRGAVPLLSGTVIKRERPS